MYAALRGDRWFLVSAKVRVVASTPSHSGATNIAVCMYVSNGNTLEKIHPTRRKYASAYEPTKTRRSVTSQRMRMMLRRTITSYLIATFPAAFHTYAIFVMSHGMSFLPFHASPVATLMPFGKT